MHPAVIRDNPKEKCPICFMPLSSGKKCGQHGVVASRHRQSRAALAVQNRERRHPTSSVDFVPLTKEIVTVGTVEFNERGLKHIAARVKGRIDLRFTPMRPGGP